MSQNNAIRQLPYDHPGVQARLAQQLTQNAAGANAASGSKFFAHTQLQVYGVTFSTVTAGTSTYTVAGTATAQATQAFVRFVSNTNTAGGVTLTTNTVGPFTIGGTTTAGTNVSVGGIGGLAGGYQGPYAINTLGGTNTTQVWGTQTYTASLQAPPGVPGIGFGGFPMNPGDVIDVVLGTDATAVIAATIQYGIQPVNGSVLA